MKLKKKLPRFNLGAMPVNIGYLRPKQINIGTSRTFLGIPLRLEADAEKNSSFVKSLGNAINTALWPLLAYQNMTHIPAGTVLKGVNAINSAGGISSILKNGGTPTVGGTLNEAGLPTEIGATTGKANTVVNGLSKLASVVGIGMGAGAVYNSFAHLNDRVSQDLIANSASTNVITTDGGNTYTERGGIDSQGIRDLLHQMDKEKKINLAINTAGLGASIGSLFTPVGGIIGAGAGFALGSIANLLGFGDNEEEIELAMREQEDVFAMLNRQSRAGALDKDTKAEFYNRQGSANGKLPGYNIGKGVARLSGGEVVQLGPIKVEVPGKKNNKDEYIARKGTLLGEMIQNPQSIVYTNKGGVSDYIKNGGDESVALEAMKNILKNYKNGKLPGYENGLWKNILGVLPYVAPHAVSLFGNLSLSNRENADVYAPDVYIDNPEGAKAVNELAQLRFDADPYYREALRGLNWANYNARRNVGLGPGGRAIAQATNYANYLRGLGDITKMYNEAQNGYTEKYAAALAQLGSTNQGRRMEAAAKRHAWMQLAMGQRESWIAQYRKNIDQNLLNAAADYMRYGLYKDTLGIQNKMLGLYERLVANEEYKSGIKKDTTPSTTRPYNPTPPETISIPNEENSFIKPFVNLSYNVQTPYTLQLDYKNWYKPAWGGIENFKNGKLPCHEDGLVDTRSDTTYRGYNPNPIPWNAGRGAAGQGPVTAILDIMKSVLPKQLGYPGDFLIEPFIRESKQPSWFDLFKDSYNNTVRNEKLGKSLNKSNSKTNKNKKK